MKTGVSRVQSLVVLIGCWLTALAGGVLAGVVGPAFRVLEMHALYTGLCFAGAAALFGLSWLLYRCRERDWAAPVALAGTAGVLAVLIVEGAARVYYWRVQPRDLEMPPAREEARFRYGPHPYLVYLPRPNFRAPEDTRHNAEGFRGPELMKAPALRIILHGGSTTYETGITVEADTWSAQTQALLREKTGHSGIEVINGGVGAHSSYESVINLALRTISLKPQIVVLFDNINDVNARGVDPPYYKPDNTGGRKSWDERTFYRIVASQNNVLLRHSLLFRTVYVRWFKYNLSVDATTLDDVMRPAVPRSESNYDRNPPIYFERNLRSFVAIARAHGVIPILMTWCGADEKPGGRSWPRLSRPYVIQHNEIVRRLSRELGVRLLDLDAMSEIRSDMSLWTEDRIHMNAKGARKKAEALTATILDALSTEPTLKGVLAAERSQTPVVGAVQ